MSSSSVSPEICACLTAKATGRHQLLGSAVRVSTMDAVQLLLALLLNAVEVGIDFEMAPNKALSPITVAQFGFVVQGMYSESRLIVNICMCMPYIRTDSYILDFCVLSAFDALHALEPFWFSGAIKYGQGIESQFVLIPLHIVVFKLDAQVDARTLYVQTGLTMCNTVDLSDLIRTIHTFPPCSNTGCWFLCSSTTGIWCLEDIARQYATMELDRSSKTITLSFQGDVPLTEDQFQCTSLYFHLVSDRLFGHVDASADAVSAIQTVTNLAPLITPSVLIRCTTLRWFPDNKSIRARGAFKLCYPRSHQDSEPWNTLVAIFNGVDTSDQEQVKSYACDAIIRHSFPSPEVRDSMHSLVYSGFTSHKVHGKMIALLNEERVLSTKPKGRHFYARQRLGSTCFIYCRIYGLLI